MEIINDVDISSFFILALKHAYHENCLFNRTAVSTDFTHLIQNLFL